MLKLGGKQETQRIVLREASGDEPEAFIVMAPIEPKMRRRSLRAARRGIEQSGVATAEEIDADLMGDLGEIISLELIRLGAIEWGGIGETVDGEDVPLPLTPDRETRLRTANQADRPTGTIDALLADEALFNLLDEKYVRPDALRRAEKNGSSGSPNGISTEATPGNATASSAAKPKRRAAAKPVRTRSTSSRQTKAKASGKSSKAASGS